MARKRTGLPTLHDMMHRQAKLIAIWGTIIRLTLTPEQQIVYDAFVTALTEFISSLGELPEGS